MPRTVIALFDHLGTARRVEQVLEAAGLLGEHLVLSSSDLRSALAGEGVPVAAESAGTHMLQSDVVASLEKHGIPAERAVHYAEAISRGGSALVLTGVADARAEEAAAILLEHRPLDPERRLSAYHDAGFAGYNPTASPFTDDGAEDRNRFADEHHGEVDVIYVM